MSAPRVSVVLPVFDGARFLPAALDSVNGQERRADEIVVVDDGSTDATPAILAAHKGIVVLRQANLGPAAARNAGVARATGDIIAFIDADDVWRRDKLAKQIADLTAHPASGFNICHCNYFLEPGIVQPAWVRPGFYDEPRVAYLPSGLVVRRQTFETVGGFDPALRVGEDTDWFGRAAERGTPYRILREVLFDRRIHGGNLSYDLAACMRATLDIVQRALARKRATPQSDDSA